MLELQSNYKWNKTKIILEENVYTRLLATINYTGFKMNMTDRTTTPNGGYEYIVLLYGNKDKDGNIVFSEVNQADYEVFDGNSKLLQDTLLTDLATHINEQGYDCCCYIHTHPYGKTESSRVFSEADIDFYKTTFNSSLLSSIFKKNITNINGIMTVSAENTPQTDDISFVYYNEQNGEMEYLPNLYARINGTLVPLKQTQETTFLDTNGKLFNSHQLEEDKKYSQIGVSRTYVELPEEVKGKSR